MKYAISALLAVLFFLVYFRMEGLVVPVMLLTLIGSAIYLGQERGGGGGWWRKGGSPDPGPVGPGPMPSEWDPPDFIPEWMLIEEGLRRTRETPPDPDPEGRRLEPLRLGATA